MFLSFFAKTVCAQSPAIDSVLEIVKKHPNDSTGVKALIWLGQYTDTKDFQLSFQYFKQALHTSEKIHTQKLSAEICNELGELYHVRGLYDSSLLYHYKSLSYPTLDYRHVSDAYRGISLTFIRQSEFDSAKFNLTKAQVISEKNNDYYSLAGILNDWGNLYLQEGNNGEALQKFIRSAKIQDSLVHDPIGQARALVNIGNIQYKMGNFDKALAYSKEAQGLAQKARYDKGIAYSSQLNGRIYRKQNKLEEALAEYRKALTGYLRMGEKRSASETHLSIGNIYFDMTDFNEAQKQYKIALLIAKDIPDETLLGFIYSALGITAQQLKKYEIAISYMDSAHVIGKKINDPYTVLDAYEVLSQVYEDQHQYKEALSYFQKYTLLKDSLNEAGTKIQVEELEMKYQNEKKAAEIELLKSEQSVQALALSRQRANLIIVALALISVVIISILLVNRYRVIGRTKRLVEMERMRNTIARDLHDDIGSTLSSINIMSQLALQENARLPDGQGNAGIHLKKIASHSAGMMEKMSDIVWSINPKNDSLEQVVIKMKEFAAEILEPKNMDYVFNIENNILALKLDVEKRKSIFLIFKEAVNNAAKYSGGNNLTVSLLMQQDTLHLAVKDNGNGFEPALATRGNGLKNMEDRAHSMNGKMRQTSQPGTGTIIQLEVPLT